MKKEILKLRKQGLTYNEIKERLGCAKSTISYHCRKNGLSKPIVKIIRKLSDDEIKKMQLFYNSIGSTRETAKKFNVAKSTVSKYIKTNAHPHKLNDNLVQEIRNYYDLGNSSKKVAMKFNVSKSTVLKYVNIRKKIKKSDTEIKKSHSKNVMSWRHRTKTKLIEYKGGECKICGYKKCIQAMEFHHLNPKEKDFTISGKSWSFERLKSEVDKCILICSNCHAEIHAGVNEIYKQ